MEALSLPSQDRWWPQGFMDGSKSRTLLRWVCAITGHQECKDPLIGMNLCGCEEDCALLLPCCGVGYLVDSSYQPAC